MVGKELTIFLANGQHEKVICMDFQIGIDQGAAALMMQTEPNRMYIIPLEKIVRFDTRFVWLFKPREMPNFPPDNV